MFLVYLQRYVSKFSVPVCICVYKYILAVLACPDNILCLSVHVFYDWKKRYVYIIGCPVAVYISTYNFFCVCLCVYMCVYKYIYNGVSCY